MDGLAISAVPVAKAGMAAGLFNTVRVAGEGIALAIVSAVLTASNTLTLQSRVHGYAPEVIHRAAGWLGAGNMPQAAALLPDFSLRALRESGAEGGLGLRRITGITPGDAEVVAQFRRIGPRRDGGFVGGGRIGGAAVPLMRLRRFDQRGDAHPAMA